MPLTDSKIKKLKPSDTCTPNRPDKYTDGNGLRLWVRHTGTKVWVCDYTFNKKRQSQTIGKYPNLTLANARKKNIELKELIANGIDPKKHKKEKQSQHDGSKLFKTIAQAWYDERETFLAPKTFSRNYSAYKRDIEPAIGDMHIDEITAPDVLAIGKAVEARGANEMARRTIREAGQVFKHAIRHGLTTNNPTIGLTEAIKPHKSKHHNTITVKELPKLLQDIDNHNGNILVKLGLWFICYTFLRTSEVRMLEWEDIDFKDKKINMPAHKMKAKRSHIVPLAPQVIKLLTEIKDLGINDQYVFYNLSYHQPLSQNAFIKALYDMGYKGEMTTHGFRALASTTLHGFEFLHEAIEQQLAHEKEDKISRAYNGARYLEHRTYMMNQWANFIDSAFKGEIIKISPIRPSETITDDQKLNELLQSMDKEKLIKKILES